MLREAVENTEYATPLSKCTRVSPAQEVSSIYAEQTEAEGSSPHDPDASAGMFINILLNVDHDTHKFMIIKSGNRKDLKCVVVCGPWSVVCNN